MSNVRMIKTASRILATAFFLGGIANSAVAQDGIGSYGQCVGDGNNNGAVTVDELITAVGNSLDGCAMRDVAIRFAARVGDDTFACGETYPGIGVGQDDFRPSDMRFYVSRVRLVTPDGREEAVELEQDGRWQIDDLFGRMAAIDGELATVTLPPP